MDLAPLRWASSRLNRRDRHHDPALAARDIPAEWRQSNNDGSSRKEQPTQRSYVPYRPRNEPVNVGQPQRVLYQPRDEQSQLDRHDYTRYQAQDDAEPTSSSGKAVAAESRHGSSHSAHEMGRGKEERASSRRRWRGSSDRLTRPADLLPPSQSSTDVSLLYPTMDPYSDRLSTHSAPDEMERRHPSLLEPIDGPGYISLFNADSPVLASRPELTAPPRVRRTRTIFAVSDAATFADDEEFNLFALATTGLGPEDVYGTPFSPSSVYSAVQEISPPHPHLFMPIAPMDQDSIPPTLARHVSMPAMPPTPATPTDRLLMPAMPTDVDTMPTFQRPSSMTEAMAHLEGMLHDMNPARRGEHDHPLSAMDMQPQALRVAGLPSNDSALAEGVTEEELPDYVQSQLQAHASRRVEAARRAQELQRRWKLRGHDVWYER